jgi:hypothetical protein
MNPDEMQSAWNSPRNNLPAEEQQQLARQFSRQMIRRRRFKMLWLTNTFVWLATITALAIRTVAVGKTGLMQEWALLPLLIAPWAFALYFMRRHLNRAFSPTQGELPVADSFRAALDSNRMEQSHLKQVARLFVIMIPLLALAMRQLHAAGKVSGRELISMALFFGAILLVSGGGIAARYFGRLQPQQKRLNALLAELTDAAR